MRVVFMGTPAFAVASLEAITGEGFEVAGVVTVPDKPAGRGLKVVCSPVKEFAMERGLTIFQPEKLRDPAFLEALAALKADLFVVVAFQMLPEVVWAMPRLGTINLHASLLPRYRGAAPINHAIIQGETTTGVTTFFIEKEIDTGQILLQKEVELPSDFNAGDLHDLLMSEGATLLVKTLQRLDSGEVTALNQAAISGGPFPTAPKIDRTFCRIRWDQPADKLHNFIRGLSPFPGAWSVLQNPECMRELQVKILESKPDLTSPTAGQPGQIWSDGKSFFRISTSNGLMDILSLQVEGKKRMAVTDFLKGFPNLQSWVLK